MTYDLFSILFLALTVGVASGAIGSFIIVKRMALVGDALSHVALPGIALTLAYGIDPFWGVLVFLLSAAVIVWWLGQRTNLPSEALVGLLFTASLAVGIVTLPDMEIIESLFGGFPELGVLTLVFVITAGLAATALTFLLARKFLFAITANDLSRVAGQGTRYELILLLIFGFVVALGIKLVGTLLMGALTIIPASVAKNVTRSMSSYVIASASLGGVIAVSGTLIANQFSFLPGPTIILLGIGFFGGSFLFKRG